MASSKRQRQVEEEVGEAPPVFTFWGEDAEEQDDDFIPGFFSDDVRASTPPSTRSRSANSCGRSTINRSSRVSVNTPASCTEALPMLLTDTDLLDCSICSEPLRNMIHQCENGHIACHSCRMKVKSKCPTCSTRISSNRCRAMEKLMESIIVECTNKMFGCHETFLYQKRFEHEKECPNAGCDCPIALCSFADSYKNLYLHFKDEHTSSAILFTYNTTFSLDVEKSQKHAILREQSDGALFILKQNIRKYGRLLSVEGIGPTLLENRFMCHLTTKCMDTSFSLESVLEIHATCEYNIPSKNYLTIPMSSLETTGQVSVRLCIKKV